MLWLVGRLVFLVGSDLRVVGLVGNFVVGHGIVVASGIFQGFLLVA